MVAKKLLTALRDEEELQLTVKGRRSGKDIPRPVWFTLRGDELLLLPVTGAASQWYKNILKNPRVKIGVKGQTYGGRLEAITGKKGVSEVVELFKQKYGAGDVKNYYSRLDVATRMRISKADPAP